MPARRKSLAELSLSGALQNRPQRYQNRFQQHIAPSRPIGRPPAHYAAEQKAVWAELIRFAPDGVLTRHDRLAIEVAVSLLMKIRAGQAKTADISALTVLLAKIGMTPADRQRMNLEVPSAPELTSEDDPWADFETQKVDKHK